MTTNTAKVLAFQIDASTIVGQLVSLVKELDMITLYDLGVLLCAGMAVVSVGAGLVFVVWCLVETRTARKGGDF